jgi:hypothetical protein
MSVALVGFWAPEQPPRAIASAVDALCTECFAAEGVSNVRAVGTVAAVVVAVCERTGALVGCVTLFQSSKRYEVWDLAVAPSARRNHVALSLLHAVLAGVPATAPLTIACHKNNAVARRLYEDKLGFRHLVTIDYSVIMTRPTPRQSLHPHPHPHPQLRPPPPAPPAQATASPPAPGPDCA